MTTLPVTLLAWAGAPAPVPAQDQRPPNAPEFGGSSPIGLVVILLLFIAVFFLIRSMNKHLKKVPASFDEPGRSREGGDIEGGGIEGGDADPPGPSSPSGRSGSRSTGAGSPDPGSASRPD